MLETIRQDVRHAARALRRTPGFTVTAVLTLALGIGATTAIFSVVNAALLTPLPYPDADRLFVLTAPGGGEVTGQIFLHVRDRARMFDSVAAQGGGNGWNLVAGDVVTYVRGMRVSEGFFSAHDVRPLVGRGFSRAEDQPRGPDAVVISEALWRQAFGGSPDAVGRSVLLGSLPYTVVGVMPEAFRTIPDADVWTPLRTTPADNGRNYRAVGRLRAGATPAQAAAELDALRPGIQREFPRMSHEQVASFLWMPYRSYLGINIRQTLFILLGAVGFLLLIACVNVASLQLTRALGRRREMAVRAALGGSRLRLIGQVLVESTLLAILGAVAGLAVAVGCTQLLIGLVSEQMSRQMLSGEAAGVDWRVLGFTLAVAVLSGLLFGVAPAVYSSRADLRATMNEGITTTMSGRTIWLRRSLACAEVALAVVLLVGAGLLVRTLLNLTRTELGFNPKGVLVGRMSLQGAIDTPQLESILRRGLERVHAIPGVAAASVSNGVPVERALNLPLAPPAGSQVTQPRSVDWRYVTPEYFAVFDIRPVVGRLFTEEDRFGGNPVAIVNVAFAMGYFGRVDVVGETIGLLPGFQDPPRQIVGVVANVKARSGSGWTRGLTALGSASAPTMFVPAGQATPAIASRGAQSVYDVAWSARTETPRPALEREMREAVRAADPRMVFLAFETMDAVIARDLDLPRFVANLLTGFAVVAIVLAAIGLYGLMGYSATQRTREIGLRMALGETAARVLRRFMREGLSIACVGLAIGIVGASALTRVLVALLFGVTPLDTATFAAVGALLLAIATAATLVPAARASRINPVEALRVQ